MGRTEGVGAASGRPRGWLAYAVSTLIAMGAVVAAAGGDPEIAAGAGSAWMIQVLALLPLGGALEARRDATRAWLGGLAARAAGLIATGTLAVADATSPRLPVSYGVAMVALLMAEAGWLYRKLPRPDRGEDDAAGTEHRLEGTRTTG